MSKFKVDFEYTIPEFTEITLDAKDADDAILLAQQEFKSLYPEVEDVEAVMVTAL